jgi:L,D-transpeptidase YcbB
LRSYFISLIFCILLLLACCSVVPAQVATTCATNVCRLAAAGHLDDLRWPDFPDYSASVQSLYATLSATGKGNLWIRDSAATDQATSIIALFGEAAAQGLSPEDYDASRWAARLGRLKSQGVTPNGVTPDEVDRWDLALTVSAMRYVSDLHFGRLNPGLYHSRMDPAHERFDLARLLREISTSADVPALVKSLDPPFDEYRRTRDALLAYRDLARQPDTMVPPLTGKPIDPGKPYDGVSQLDALLRRLGDLPANTPPPDPGLYRGPLVNAVKRFQARHGLDPDGRIGAGTVKQLNVPLSHRVRQLELKLERWRWVPHEFSRPPIVVNIPEFRLRGMDSSYRTEIEMKVVVGKAYKHETPVFASDLREVIFRPYWNVPASILKKETIPDIVKDRAYLAKNEFEVVTRDDKVVMRGEDVSDDILKQLRSGKLTVRQVPGAKNALGLVKFVFPNEYDVYMHATPARALFSRSRRDFSHGCIRVERPEDLAEWVLRGPERASSSPATPEVSPWTRERIVDAMQGVDGQQIDDKHIGLRAAIPVLIIYATAVVLDGETRFFEDIYGQDTALEAALEKGPPYPSRKPRP